MTPASGATAPTDETTFAKIVAHLLQLLRDVSVSVSGHLKNYES
jgi:hypothetical protein